MLVISVLVLDIVQVKQDIKILQLFGVAEHALVIEGKACTECVLNGSLLYRNLLKQKDVRDVVGEAEQLCEDGAAR